MTDKFPECECFKTGDPRRAICRNERADMPLHGDNSINKYRAKWGFSQIEGESKSPVKPKRLSTLQRGVSFAKTLGGTIKNKATTGKAYVSDDVRLARLAICQTCEHHINGNCDLCGCGCNASNRLSNKLAHPTAVCPAGKWGAAEAVKQKPQSPRPQQTVAPGSLNQSRLVGIPIDRDKLVSHILYHVMPVAGETEWVWRKHLDRLREVRDQFNGRLIVGVVTPGKADHWKYHSVNEVREALAGLDAEIVEAPNHVGAQPRSGRGENILWPLMLEKIETTDPNEVFFYGHCKGVSRPGYTPDKAPHIWADAMFETLFGNRAAAIDALDNHGTCGPFRMTGGFRPGLPGVGDKWFFSGTFFAMRSVDVFRRKWRDVPRYYGGVERMPQAMFSLEQSACLFFDNVNNLYSDEYWTNEVTPALIQWRKQNGTVVATQAEADVSIASRLQF